jgi:hypothetical protein
MREGRIWVWIQSTEKPTQLARCLLYSSNKKSNWDRFSLCNGVEGLELAKPRGFNPGSVGE